MYAPKLIPWSYCAGLIWKYSHTWSKYFPILRKYFLILYEYIDISQKLSYILVYCVHKWIPWSYCAGWMWKYFHISSKVGLGRWDPWIYGNPCCRRIKTWCVNTRADAHYMRKTPMVVIIEDQVWYLTKIPGFVLRFRFSPGRESKLAEPDSVGGDDR